MKKKIKKPEYTALQIAILANAFERSNVTIERWIRNEDDRLTSDKAKKALSMKLVMA